MINILEVFSYNVVDVVKICFRVTERAIFFLFNLRDSTWRRFMHGYVSEKSKMFNYRHSWRLFHEYHGDVFLLFKLLEGNESEGER